MAISVGDAVLKLGVDTKDLDQGLNQVTKNIKTSTEKWKKGLRIAGAAFTAVGVAGLKLVGDARKMNAALAQTAITMGTTTGSLRDLALATTNVTFPLESVVATFEVLSRAGVTNQDAMMASATAFDTLADATGTSAEAVAKQLIPAFKLFNLELPQTAAELDNFTWMTKNTSVEIAEFGSVMSYVAQYGADLNLTLDDMIAIMAVLESKGQSGSTATKMFRTAVTQAASGAQTLNEALGITTEEVEHFKTEMVAAEGVTQDYADAANEQYGIMDKLKQKWSELSLKIGSLLTPLEPLLGIMTALGPVMMIMSTSMGTAAVRTVAHTVAMVAHKAAMIASAVATGAWTAAQWLLNVAMNANPIGLIITIVGVLGLAIYALSTKFDSVRKVMVTVWNHLKILFAQGVRTILEKAIKPFLEGLASVIDFGSKIVGFFNKEWGAAMKKAADSVRGAVDSAIEYTYSLEDTSRALLDQADAVEEAAEAVDDAVVAWDLYNTVIEPAAQFTEDVVDAMEGAAEAAEDETQAMYDLWKEIDNVIASTDEFTGAQEEARAKVQDVWEEMVIADSELGKMGVTLDDVIEHYIDLGTEMGVIEAALLATEGAIDPATALYLELGGAVEAAGDSFVTAAAKARGARWTPDEEPEVPGPEDTGGGVRGGRDEVDEDLIDLLERYAGAADWVAPLASVVQKLADDFILPVEFTQILRDMVEGAFDAGEDWFKIVQAIGKTSWATWNSILEGQITIQNGFASRVAVLVGGIDDLSAAMRAIVAAAFFGNAPTTPPAVIPPWLSNLPNFQEGGMVPGIGPRLAVVHGGETFTPPGQSTSNSVYVAQLVVREEADVERIAQKLFQLQTARGFMNG